MADIQDQQQQQQKQQQTQQPQQLQDNLAPVNQQVQNNVPVNQAQVVQGADGTIALKVEQMKLQEF
jgi:hypothetical protein